MKTLNPLERNRQNYIEKMLSTPLAGYTNEEGEQAGFDDVAWIYTYPDGRKVNFLFHDISKATKKIVQIGNVKKTWRLDGEKRYLIMAFAIDMVSDKGSHQSKGKIVSAAKSILKNDIHKLTQNELEKIVCSCSQDQSMKRKRFFNWLKENKFISHTLRYPSIQSKYSKYNILEINQSKMPDEKSIAALGAIFSACIPADEASWPDLQKNTQRHAFVATMSALALASPNRVAAEQTVLVNQEIRSHQLESGSVINWLDWQGSKGYKDNRNHLVAPMVEPLKRGLKYIRQVTEPGRVLARFYHTPTAKLKDVLGNFKPSERRMKLSQSKMDAPVHLIQLGYLLEFYDEDQDIQVPKEEKGVTRKSLSNRFYYKPIRELTNSDRILMTEGVLINLLGTRLEFKQIQLIFHSRDDSKAFTVNALQSGWIAHIRKSISTFPKLYASGTNWVNCFDAMFVFSGKTLAPARGKSGLYTGASSFYGLAGGKTLSHLFKGSIANHKGQSIFEHFGFSSDFCLRPHQFRHWLNDTGERAGISHALLNLWSGRKSPEQILAYVHSTEGERASVVRDILFKDSDATEEPDEAIKPIKVYSMEEYERLSGMHDGVASVTSTGFCDQNLMTSPCEYLNDFESQCTLCERSCHVKGDGNSLEFLKKDHTVQLHRLEEIQAKPKFSNSAHMQAWYNTHHPNVFMLEQLIELLQDDSIEDGSVIRILPSKSETRITDLTKKTVTTRKLALPNTDQDLEQSLEDLKRTETDRDDRFTQLLELF